MFRLLTRALTALRMRLFGWPRTGRSIDRGWMSPGWVAAQRAARYDR
jgi:hypothetical protein